MVVGYYYSSQMSITYFFVGSFWCSNWRQSINPVACLNTVHHRTAYCYTSHVTLVHQAIYCSIYLDEKDHRPQAQSGVCIYIVTNIEQTQRSVDSWCWEGGRTICSTLKIYHYYTLKVLLLRVLTGDAWWINYLVKLYLIFLSLWS